jgi:hypothetical protein
MSKPVKKTKWSAAIQPVSLACRRAFSIRFHMVLQFNGMNFFIVSVENPKKHLLSRKVKFVSYIQKASSCTEGQKLQYVNFQSYMKCQPKKSN